MSSREPVTGKPASRLIDQRIRDLGGWRGETLAGRRGRTQVIYRLEPDGDGTRVFVEHSGFDTSQPWGEQAFRGAEFGWAKMLERLPGVVGSIARCKGG